MASGGIARGRLAEERKSWRKNHPHGFVAKPETLPDGTVNLMVWKCVIPGKQGVQYANADGMQDKTGQVQRDAAGDDEADGKKQDDVGHKQQEPSTEMAVFNLTDWEGGYFPLTLEFNDNYPSNPPMCKFPPGFFHVNVYNTGEVCLSIIGSAWKPSISVKQVLVGIQELLDDPNPDSAAQGVCYDLYKKNMPEYKNRVGQQAKKYPSRV